MSPPKQDSTKTTSESGANVEQATASDAALIELQQRLTEWLSSVLDSPEDDTSITSLLTMIADEIKCDLVEINIHQEILGTFKAHRWVSRRLKGYVKSHLPAQYPLGHGYTGWLAEHLSILSIPDTTIQQDPLPFSLGDTVPFRSYIGTPLTRKGQLLGTLEIAHHQPGGLTQADAAKLVAIAHHLSLGLHVIGLQHRTTQLSLLQQGSARLSQLSEQEPDRDSYWKDLSYALPDLYELHIHGLFMFDRDKSTIRTPFFLRKSGKAWKHDEALIESPAESDLAAILHHQEYWLSNRVDHEDLSRLGMSQVRSFREITRLILIPFRAEGDQIGLLLAGRRKKGRDFSDDETSALLTLSQQIGAEFQSYLRHIKDTRRPPPATTPSFAVVEATISPERMAELLRLSAELTTSLDLDRSLSHILRLSNELMSADQAVFLTLEDPQRTLTLRHMIPEAERPDESSDPLLEVALAMSEWVISSSQGLFVDELSNDDRWKISRFESLCAVPCSSSDEISGVILFFAKSSESFGPDERQLATIIAQQLANALNHTHLYAIIREQADRLGLMLRSKQIETSQSNAILESIADGVIVTDSDHNVILYNAAAERILNLPVAHVIGREIFEHIGIFGEDTVQWDDTLREWKSTPPEQHHYSLLPERILLEDGRIISILPAPVVLGGDFQGTVSIFRDISREVEVDRLKSEFVATVSHELRTPMTSIKGFVDLMLMGASGELNEEQRHFLDIVRTNTTRLEILVNDLLDISRIEAGKATLVFQELDVQQLLAEMEQYIQHRCHEESKNMVFSYESAKGLPPIWGDLERVRQILANLVENSFDYTPENGLIEMRAREVDGQIQIEVEDNGMGISLEEQERIFERFYRGEQALIMGVSGTGLGLSIVLNLVEMHQGRIWVTSGGPGKGTTFTVSLPIATGRNNQLARE